VVEKNVNGGFLLKIKERISNGVFAAKSIIIGVNP